MASNGRINNTCPWCGYKGGMNVENINRSVAMSKAQGFEFKGVAERPVKLYYGACGNCLSTTPLGQTPQDCIDKANKRINELLNRSE